ncbi:GmrSD restriction endonuclease domain-containing protein [Cellulomonas alba]|uniref:Excalibur calcium-binding domain-containing protein n=1 Tax=Cellulomonas alba TaxID=3053467 RepID=A0ABT7SG33_9CELL|nr:DUF1524 domain-containing protein [Cellulomonas alba]MDM7855135.1 excalibur calcium-binding domain-containing protein [Cellulomonas alba]
MSPLRTGCARRWIAVAALGSALLAGCEPAATDAGLTREHGGRPVGGAGSPTGAPPSASSTTGPGGPADAASTPAASSPAPTGGSPTAGDAGRTGTALAALALLRIKGRAPMTGYTRDEFGPAWKDVDRNGCDTRDDVLARDLDDPVRRDACVIASGTLHDPYTGTTIDFVRGVGTSQRVQIDHVVALGDAWQKGAQQWDAARRTAFANDPLELLAVDGPTNAQKGDGDAATWLPPRKAYRCAYVARQVAVKYTYGLWVTQAEHDAIARILAACPGQPLPAGSAVPPANPRAAAGASGTGATGGAGSSSAGSTGSEPGGGASGDSSSASGTGSTGSSSGGTAVYANCAAAWAAGAAPLHRGDPGYGPRLDRDGDGVACESRP